MLVCNAQKTIDGIQCAGARSILALLEHAVCSMMANWPFCRTRGLFYKGQLALLEHDVCSRRAKKKIHMSNVIQNNYQIYIVILDIYSKYMFDTIFNLALLEHRTI